MQTTRVRITGFLVVLFTLVTSLFHVGNAQAQEASLVYKNAEDGAYVSSYASSLISVVDDVIYQAISDVDDVSILRAIDQAGQELWSYEFPADKSIIAGHPIDYVQVDKDGNAYVLVRTAKPDENEIYMFYVASVNSNGELNWEYPLDKYVYPSTLEVGSDGTVYFGTSLHHSQFNQTGENLFYALTPSGDVKWTLNLEGNGSMAGKVKEMPDGNIILTNWSWSSNYEWLSKGYTLSPTGEIVSEKTLNSLDYVDPEGSGNYLSFLENRSVLRLSDKNDNELWRLNESRPIGMVGFGPDNTFYASASYQEDGKYLSSFFPIKDGKVAWEIKGDKHLYGMLRDGNEAYVVFRERIADTNDYQSLIQRINLENGQVLAETRMPNDMEGMTINSDGSLLLSNDKAIYKFNGTTPPQDGGDPGTGTTPPQDGGDQGTGTTPPQDGEDQGTGTTPPHIQTGWVHDGTNWSYFNNQGVKKTGWLLDSGKWYYFDQSGTMQTGWELVSGKWYYFNTQSGAMKTGWLLDGGKYYYLEASGAMKTGWVKDGGTWYYLETSGVMKTGWLTEGNKWFYLNTDGSMQTGWKQVGSKWYFFYSSGEMAAGTIIGSYKFAMNGEWIQ
ncbi:hypothetical protein FZW96_07325 [Bacillus sp. BGMRC 2118]|nr:hypothetical protein FZW96_07325 [Bacillus sp. BGMRC 2118]